MLRRVLLSFVLATLGSLYLGAQNDFRKAFDDFTTNAMNRHAAFTDTANALFVKAIAQNWSRYELSDGNLRQEKPKPGTLPVAEKAQTQFNLLPISETIEDNQQDKLPETASVRWLPQKSSSRTIRFTFYDAEQVVSIPQEYGSFHPKGISEKEVAAFWEQLSRYNYQLILADCNQYIETCGYNDWAVQEWVRALSAAIFPHNIHSEQTIFTVFLLNQMGLKTKIARADDRLIGLFSSRQSVYTRKFLQIDSYPFYVAENDFSASAVYTYNVDFAQSERPVDLRIQKPLRLGGTASYKTYKKDAPVLQTSMELPVNEALLRFYSHYPQTTVTVYATACPEERFASALLSGLKDCIRGMSDLEAVNKILTFAQTDFRYQTDIDQFGYEKPYFCEENFVYQANDCEDRAALFAYLVRSLVGCDVVLLEYPDHISTAVHLNGEVKGDRVRVKGRDFYVCDPSFIGSTLGMTIPKYKNQAVKVYVL